MEHLDWQESAKERHNLSMRLTHGYVGTWRHLDEWLDIGSLTVLSRGSVVEEDSIEEYTTTYLMVAVELDQPEPKERIEQAIRSVFNSHGCSHEYDCCGCWSTYVTEVVHTFNNVWAVQTSSSRNY